MKATGISKLCHLPTTKPSLSFRFCSNSVIHHTSFHNNNTNFPKFLLSATMEASFKPDEARVPAALPLPTPTLTKFKIALCQLSVTTDKERNIAHAQQAIEDAADKGAQLILLPEIWNSPYSNDSFPVYAEDIDAGGDASPSTRMLSEVSRSLKITIIGGSIPERSGDKLYNSCCVFGTDGKLLAKHRKIHLFDIDIPGKMTFKESKTLTAGTRPTIVDTEVGRIGIGICYDIRFQELAAIYAARGAHLLCYPGAFNMTTGPLHWELLQRARAADCQKYVMDLLDELHMTNCKGVPTPMASTCTFADSEVDSVVDMSLYRRIIGKLHYLSFTRPDIGFAVNKLSQFMHNPKVSHLKAIKRLLRYLKHTSTLGVQLSRQPTDRLLAYSDSDWAGNPQDRTSTIGYVVYLGNSPISWSSKKQKSVFRSSTEAEYRAVAAAVSEVNWLTNLLRELHLSLSAGPTIFCDNVSTTYICANPVFHSRMKHVAIDFHFVREQVQQKELEVRHLHSADQVADVLTKPLPRTAFQRHFHKLGLVPVTPNLLGRIKR